MTAKPSHSAPQPCRVVLAGPAAGQGVRGEDPEKTGSTWDHIRRVTQLLEVVIHRCSAGEGRRCTEVTAEQQEILPALGIPAPPRDWVRYPATTTHP